MNLEFIQNIEPKAWLYICRKKPKLRELSFKPKCLGLESMGFKPHPMVLIEEVIEILKSQSRPVHLAQLSWGGFNLHGDEKSIREAQRLLHEAAKVPALYERIDELQKIPELNPEDIVVDVVYKQLGGFAPIVSHGVRVAHKPSRISVVVDSERSQHKNRQLALQALRSIISEEFKS